MTLVSENWNHLQCLRLDKPVEWWIHEPHLEWHLAKVRPQPRRATGTCHEWNHLQ